MIEYMQNRNKKVDRRILIAHVIHRLQVGGLENGLVNLINNMPKEKYRHAIICVKDYTSFKDRIKTDDVEYYALHKKEGNDPGAHYRLWKIFKKIRPTVMHTRNIGTIEYVIAGKLAGVKYCIHGEHGRDMADINGNNNKYIYLRRLLSPFINTFIALSKDLEVWLTEKVKIPRRKVIQLYNGVDTVRFSPIANNLPDFTNSEGRATKVFKIGTVGRFSGEKDQLTLIKAFIILLNKSDIKENKLKLTMIGDGPLKNELVHFLEEANVSNLIEMPGECNDIATHLRNFDVFVLPSLGEGISNTILEAMSSGLPVIATNVGGNPELVTEGETGFLVEPENPDMMADKIYLYIKDQEILNANGKNARHHAVNKFSMNKMVEKYVHVYDSLTLVT